MKRILAVASATAATAALAVSVAWTGPASAAPGKPGTPGAPGAPLTLSGTGPSAGALTLIKKPGPYKTVYTCTLVVKKKVTVKKRLRKVVIETGFGGEASSAARHHPAG